MDSYFCKSCNYHTIKLSHFKRHMVSKKHCKDNEPSKVANEEYKQYKKKLFFCDNCDSFFVSKQSLQRHSFTTCKTSTLNTIKKENKELKKKLKLKDVEISNKDAEISNKEIRLDKMIDIARENSKTANTTTNMLKYAQLHFLEADPLEQLTGDNLSNVIKYKNPKNKETTNETYVKTVIYNYNHKIFPNFIGDMIIEHYKPKKMTEANLIATDISRLSFIIMQKLAKKGKTQKKEWINDKSGKKFAELVLVPVIDAVKETLTSYINFKNSKEPNEKTLELMTKCLELRRDIEVSKFTKPILRYVAPNFHFDKLKLLDDNEDIISNISNISNISDISDSSSFSDSSDEEPIKIITKNKKKK